MQNLYKPVFWCGFALSLLALYTSSEHFNRVDDVAVSPPTLEVRPSPIQNQAVIDPEPTSSVTPVSHSESKSVENADEVWNSHLQKMLADAAKTK